MQFHVLNFLAVVTAVITSFSTVLAKILAKTHPDSVNMTLACVAVQHLRFALNSTNTASLELLHFVIDVLFVNCQKPL